MVDDQELMESYPTSDPQIQEGKKHTHKLQNMGRPCKTRKQESYYELWMSDVERDCTCCSFGLVSYFLSAKDVRS